jgi:hypothetical protein
MPDITSAVQLPQGVSISDCLLFVFHEELSLAIYRATVGDIQSPVLSYLDSELAAHAGYTGNGYHIPTNGLSHGSLTNKGSLTHDQLDDHVTSAGLHVSRSWAALTLQNAWVSAGADYGTPMAVNRSGAIQLQGDVVGGTYSNGVIIAIVPAGYRPQKLVVIANISSSYVEVYPSGDVRLYNRTSGGVPLYNIIYEVV